MATAKTGSFYLTETIEMPAAQAAGIIGQATIDLGAYVNVPTGQAIAIDSVDFIVQNSTAFSGSVGSMLAANGSITYQLTDLNPASLFVRADSQSLVASGCLNIDAAANIASHTTDLFPDEFGPTNLSDAFMVVNDSLFLTAGNNGAAVGANPLFVTARVRCRVVKLGQKDWMAIAIQATAEA